MSIDISNYRTWKKDVVTKALFKSLKEARELVSDAMVNSDTIMRDDCSRNMAKLLGMREGIDLVLEMTFEDFKNGEDVYDEEEVNSSRPQSSGEAEQD